MGSLDHVPRPALVTFGWWQNLGGQMTDGLMPHQITGARLAEEVDADRWLHLVLAVGAVAGVLTGIWSLLDLYFQHGIMSAEVRGWPARTAPQATFRFIQNWLNDPTRVPRRQMIAFLAGGAHAALLVWLRQSLCGLAAPSRSASRWRVTGGCRRLVPVLRGLAHQGHHPPRRRHPPLPRDAAVLPGRLLGDFLIPMGWAVIGLITGQQMYLSYPH